MTDNEAPKAVPNHDLPWFKILIFGVVVAAVTVGYTQFGAALSPKALAERESELRDFQDEHPVLVYGIAFAIYAGATGLSLPGAAGLSMLFAWYFGFLRGLVLVSFASTSGASIAFLLSRYLFRDAVQSRFGDRLAAFNDALAKEGSFYLFTLRLIPAFPFWMINLVMGLTPMKTRTFWWVSQLGMFPGTCVYLYAGSSIPDLQTLADKGIGAVLSPRQLIPILIAFGLLGVFPLVVKKLMQRFQPAADLDKDDDEVLDPPSETSTNPVQTPNTN